MNFRIFSAAVLLLAPAASLHAQGVGGSAGIALPVGSLAEHRGVGFRAQGSVYSPGGLLRGDVAGVFFPGDDSADTSPSQSGDWRSVGIAGNVLPRLMHTETLSVRALAGLSAHRTSIPGVRNPYGVVPGGQLGGVVERSVGRGWLTVEGGLHLVATDHGVGELEPVIFVPLTVGFRW
jgi:hypothetical protein